MKEQQNHRTLLSLTFTLSKVTLLASPYSILYFIYLYSVKFFDKGETRNVKNGLLMSDHINTREMRRNPRDKAHHHKTLSAGGTTAIVQKLALLKLLSNLSVKTTVFCYFFDIPQILQV